MEQSWVRVGAAVSLGLTVAMSVSTAASATGDGAPGKGSSTVSAQALPPGSVKHQTGPNWVWFGPRNWQAATGAYGITLSAPDGLTSLDYGFSSTLCAPGNSVAESVTQYFAQQRAQLGQAGSWRQLRVQANAVRQLPPAQFGANYFRQTVQLSGRAQGVAMRGEVVFEYSLATGPTYCFSRNQARVAPARGFAQSIRQLRSMQSAVAYSAPSYCTGNTVDPVCRSN